MIHFFGDYTRGEIGKSCVTHFYEGFEQYSDNFGNIKLQKAINEARIFLLSDRTIDECLVCKIPQLKQMFREKEDKS